MTPNEPVRRRRKTLNDNMIAKLPRKRKRYIQADPEARHVYLRVPPEGPIVFTCVCRDKYKEQIWTRLGDTSGMTIAQARDLARTVVARLREGKSAFEPPPPKPETFKAVAEEWFTRVVVAAKHRSGDEIRRCLEYYVYPVWAEKHFVSLRRSDIVKLRDAVSDKNGHRQSGVVFGIVSRIFAWYALRDDTYTNPIVKGMRPAANEARERVLFDDTDKSREPDFTELRAVWHTAEANGIFGAFIRLALLTAQRRAVLLNMKWGDLNGDTWTIPLVEREKNNAGSLKLPAMAMEILERLPRFEGNPYVFAGRRGRPMAGVSELKAKLEQQSGTSNWTIHDCRRTARSLLSRAGISRDISERILGHVVGSKIERTYDRHDYREEMAHGLRALASLIGSIVNPPADNIRVLRRREAKS